MAADFKITKNHDFYFDFDVDGETVRKTISIDMTDESLGKKLISAQNRVIDKVNEIKIKDVKFKSKEFPDKLETFEDFVKLNSEQRDDILAYSDAISDYENKTNAVVINEINNSLNTDISSVFEYLRPLDMYNGEPFAVAVLKSLGEKIIEYSKQFAKEQKKRASKKDYMKAYLK